MAYWSAYLSHMAYVVTTCGYMGMFGPWRSPNQDGADVFYSKHRRVSQGASIARIGTNPWTIGAKCPSFSKLNSLILP